MIIPDPPPKKKETPVTVQGLGKELKTRSRRPHQPPLDLALAAMSSRLGDATMAALADWGAFRSLQTLRLNLCGNGNITPEGFRAIGRLLDRRTSHLRRLHLLASNPIGWGDHTVKDALASAVDGHGVAGGPAAGHPVPPTCPPDRSLRTAWS